MSVEEGWYETTPDLSAYGYEPTTTSTEAPSTGGSSADLDPRQMEPVPDPLLLTYETPVISAMESIGTGSFAATTEAPRGSAADSARLGSTNDSLMVKLATWMGFTNQNDFAKALLPATAMVAGGIISGLGAGYAASQKRKLEKQMIDSQTTLNNVQAAKIQSQTANQAGIAGMKINQGGLIGAPWRPAPIVAPSQRTA